MSTHIDYNDDYNYDNNCASDNDNDRRIMIHNNKSDHHDRNYNHNNEEGDNVVGMTTIQIVLVF